MTHAKQTYLLLCFFSLPTLFFAQNLIKNGDCEAPPPTLLGITDWSMVAGITWKRGTEFPAQSGNYYFFPQRVANAELAQNVDVSAFTCTIDAGGQGFEFKGYMRSLNQTETDFCRIVLEYQNAGGTTLSTFDTGNQAPTNDTWQLIRDTRIAPRGTRRVRVRLISTRNWGDDNDGVYDNLSLVPVPNVMKLDSTIVKNATCVNLNANGEVRLVVSGGVRPLSFSVNNGAAQTDSIVRNLRGQQQYNIKITDASGCYTLNTTAQIGSTNLPILGVSAALNTFCGLNNGQVSQLASGGTGSLSFSLDSINWKQTGNFNNLAAGNYRVWVRDSLGCTIVSNTNLTVATSVAAKIDTLKITPSVCGDKKGKIEVVGSGKAPLQFGFDTTRLSTKTLYDTLAAGNYTLYIRDAAGCSSSKTATITKTETPKIVALEASPESCLGNDGKVKVIAESAYKLNYRLDSAAFVKADSFKNLKKGAYTITVRDSFGCEAQAKINIDREPLPIFEEIRLGKTECLKATGTLLIKARSAAGGLSYAVDSGRFQNDNIFRDLKAGKLRVYVKDAKGCQATKDTVVGRDCGIFVPNIFSPNGDNINDRLGIFGDPSVFEKILTFQVFSRWGNIVYDGANSQLNNTASGWDGTLDGTNLNNGIYVYILKVQLKNGETVQQSGDIFLTR